ncbi:MAG: O-antigen ligase family protein [Planctomycetes bacterium]|nr:O-antigen ligase family protein [Planctomycetota bacterium]
MKSSGEATRSGPVTWLRTLCLYAGFVCLPALPAFLFGNVVDGDLPRLAVLHLALLLCLVTCLRRAVDPAARLRPTPGGIVVLALVAAKGGSLLVAPDRVLAVRDLVTWEGPVLLALLATCDPAFREAFRRLLFGPCLGVAAALAGHGLLQSRAAADAGSGAAALAWPVSLLDNPNFAGEFAGPALVLAAAALWRETGGPARPARAAATALLAGWLVVLGSRGAWVGAVAGLTVAAVLEVARVRLGRTPEVGAGGKRARGRGRAPDAAACVLAACATAAGIGLGLAAQGTERAAARLASTADPGFTSTRVRLLLWRASRRMFLEHPLLGVGAGNFPRAYAAYRPAEERRLSGPESRADAAHNDFVQFAVEAGVPGGLAYLLLVGWVACLAWRAGRGTGRSASPGAGTGAGSGEAADDCAPGLAGALGASLVIGFVSNPLLRASSSTWFWAALFALEAAVDGRGGLAAAAAQVGGAPARTGLRAAALAAVLLALLAGFARVDLPRADADRVLGMALVASGPSIESLRSDRDVGDWRRFGNLRYVKALLGKALSLDPHRYFTAMALGKVLEVELAAAKAGGASASIDEGVKAALEAYGRAAKIDPTDATAHRCAGMVHVREKAFAPAQAEFETAMVLDPQSEAAVINWGLCLNSLGKAEEVESEMGKLLARHPGLAQVEFMLARLSAARGDVAKSLALLRAAREHGRDVSSADGEAVFAPLRELPEFRGLMAGE